MAFDSNTSRNSNSRDNSQGKDDWKTAAGFLNFSLPGPDGTTSKVGKGLPLEMGKGNDELIAFLAAHEDNAMKLISSGALTVNYRSATPQNKPRFDLTKL